MEKYSLRFAAGDASGERSLSFSAQSMGDALELAKCSAGGDRAELFDNDQSICKLELVSDCGVWLIGGLVLE